MPLPDRDLRLRLAVPRRGDWLLAGLLAEATGLTQSECAALVVHGSCQVDGLVTREPDQRLPSGALLVIRYVARASLGSPLIRHADDCLVVVEKPAGIPVQPTAQGAENSLVEQVAKMTASKDLHVVHRLDLAVSGLLALARGRAAAAALTKAFSAGAIEKLYLAAPAPTEDGSRWLDGCQGEVTIDEPLLWVSRRRRALLATAGKPSRTNVLHAAREEAQWLLLLRLHTGRTHQIRAHLADVGLPLIGDVKYGAPTRAERIGLHSIHLSLPHPVTGESLRFWATPPDDFLELAKIEWDETCTARWRQHIR